MRIRVHGASLRDDRRMALAAVSLGLRGHDVTWEGPAPAEAAGGGTAPRLARPGADVVLGGPHPASVAWTARLTHATCMVLALDPAVVARWGTLARWAWNAQHAFGLVAPAEADAALRDATAVAPERIGLWADGAAIDAADAAHPDTEILERACERALARSRSRAPRAAVFADRDGTLIVERDYLADPDGVSLIPGVSRALADLRAAGFPVVVISNQSGVGRGRFTLARAYAVMARLREHLRAEGVELDAIYLCPHRPEEVCACRKPGTALLERAAEDQQLTLARSFMVGDKRIDVETAVRAGGRGVLVRTGYGREEELRPAAPDGADTPAFVAEDFAAAAAWILAHEDPIEGR